MQVYVVSGAYGTMVLRVCEGIECSARSADLQVAERSP